MNRVPTPADYNDTTERFARTMGEGRLCDVESAQAIFREPDAPAYGMAWRACMAVLTTLACIVMVATA